MVISQIFDINRIQNLKAIDEEMLVNMNKLIALMITLIASVMPACADINADANRLFVEAMQAWKQS